MLSKNPGPFWRQKNSFFKEIRLYMNFIWIPNLEKTNATFPRKHPHRGTKGQENGRMGEQEDVQVLFYRTLLANARCPIKCIKLIKLQYTVHVRLNDYVK